MLSKSPRYTVVMQQSKSKCNDHSPFTTALIARLAQPGVEGEAERTTLRCRTRPAHVFGIKFEVPHRIARVVDESQEQLILLSGRKFRRITNGHVTQVRQIGNRAQTNATGDCR